MSEKTFNGAPFMVSFGTEDASTRNVARESTPVPQHLPKWFIFGKKGPFGEQLTGGAERLRIYGDETFDMYSPYYMHTTEMANRLDEVGNVGIYVRVRPDDIGPPANLVAYLDVLETTVDRYQRNTDGSLMLDALGRPVVSGQTAGIKAKWVVEHYADAAAFQNYGKEVIKNGDQVEGSKQSRRYPIFALRDYSQGSAGNLNGIRFYGLTSRMGNLPTEYMRQHRAFPYGFQFLTKANEASSPNVFKTVFGEPSITLSLKQGATDPSVANRRMHITETLLQSYRNLRDTRYPIEYGLMDGLVVYQQNIEDLLTLFHSKEVPFIRSSTDFTADPADKHLFNFVTGVDSSGVPYESFVFVDDPNSTKFSEYTNVYAKGGSDGTMTPEVLDRKVEEYMARYADPNDELQDRALHPESTVIDSGFGFTTKKSLLKMLAIRADTYVTLATHIHGKPALTASEEFSIGVALRTQAMLYPESTHFGTPCMRARIWVGSGMLTNSQWPHRVPLSFVGAIKDAKLAGASNGMWKTSEMYMGQPGSDVTEVYDINIRHVPNSNRMRYWDGGLCFVLPKDRETYFVPAFRSVYSNDTSVLTSWPTVMMIAHLNKIAHSVWIEFCGRDDLSELQMVENVNNSVRRRVKGLYGNRYTIIPRAMFSEMDSLLGYRWTLPIDVGAENMRTVMQTYVRALRKKDLVE